MPEVGSSFGAKNGEYIFKENDERDEIELQYTFSDGKKEIIKIANEEEEE